MRVTRFAIENGRALFPDYFIVDDNSRLALAFYSAYFDTNEIVQEGLQLTPWLSTRWRGTPVSFNTWRQAFATNGHAFPTYHAQIADKVRLSELVDINRAFVELFMNSMDLTDPLNAQTYRELMTERNVDFVDFMN